MPLLLTALLAYLLVCVVLALRKAANDPPQLGVVALIAAAAVFLSARWLYAASEQLALLGLALFAAGLVASGGRTAPPRRASPAPVWIGLAIIALTTALKFVDLAEFPPDLNAYSAETGVWGLLSLDGDWPDEFLRGQKYDLVDGGRSPLHLPLMWMTVRLVGGTVYALRCAEVVASTALLLVFWGWLRGRVFGVWAPVVLAAFALSPWHLAQSRMGTFYSASVAVALATLWIADRLVAERPQRLWLWSGFGLCAGLMGYAYAPIRVLYLFFILVTVSLAWSAWRQERQGWWRGPAIALAVFGCFFSLQVGYPPRFEQILRQDFGQLATDTSVWHKTTADQVSELVQPVAVVAANVWRNLQTWWRSTWSEERILVWYAPALAVAMPTAILLLFRSAYRVPALFFLIGALPPLIVFPVQRRTVVLWPLVYVAGVAAGRELGRICGALIDRRWWRRATWTLFATAMFVAGLHGLKVYATTNSMVGLGPYFGPDHQLQMLLEAERMLPVCRVYIVDATKEDKVVAWVRLFDPARRLGEVEGYGFLDLPRPGQQPAVLRDRPICFFRMARPEPSDGFADLVGHFPGSFLLRRWAADGSDTLLYSVLMVAGGESDAGG